MGNIFLLPTDKPTILHFDDKLFLSPNYQYSKIINSIVEGRNICITSDEEIKEGDWFYDDLAIPDSMKVKYLKGNLKSDKKLWLKRKKIILTTDQDLIADGVQAIDDTFLEWFVNNPSCEEVEIKTYATNCSCENQTKNRFGDNKIDKNSTCHLRNKCNINYKIIIPKKEPKLCGGHLQFLGMVTPATEAYECIICRQEYRHTNTMGGNIFPLSKCTNGISQKEYLKIREGFKKSIDGQNHFIQHFKNGGTVKDFKPLEKVKQETLEEAAEDFANSKKWMDGGVSEWVQHIFKEGAKWQAERMYSEEEFLAFGKSCFYKGFEKSEKDDANCFTAFREEIGSLFEKFKKK